MDHRIGNRWLPRKFGVDPESENPRLAFTGSPENPTFHGAKSTFSGLQFPIHRGPQRARMAARIGESIDHPKEVDHAESNRAAVHVAVFLAVRNRCDFTCTRRIAELSQHPKGSDSIHTAT